MQGRGEGVYSKDMSALRMSCLLQFAEASVAVGMLALPVGVEKRRPGAGVVC